MRKPPTPPVPALYTMLVKSGRREHVVFSDALWSRVESWIGYHFRSVSRDKHSWVQVIRQEDHKVVVFAASPLKQCVCLHEPKKEYYRHAKAKRNNLQGAG